MWDAHLSRGKDRPLAITPTEEILSAAREGQPRALRDIYEFLAPSILAYLAGKGCDDPEGLTQEVFLTLFGKLGNLTGGVSGLRTFAFSVAHARMVDDVRRRERQPVLAQFDPQADDRFSSSAEETVLGSASGVSALLQGLTRRHQEVLLLRVVADLSIEETAKIMGISAGAVKQLQGRALKTLKDRMEHEEVPDHEQIA
ncbi:RNA polymerase sigma factor [Arthrobacter sunyaminii]|uniref:RNA polymerase sigma factor n=1 Tax=Arthrobacter sunyaminii TaxID=2816859 RepID=A0A975XKP6_9MICC|nr:RNA polymerase sigma factor [Arthrobacter sunyaminii]QWQ36441.1 RNA polymerase sigma factor [Arthrobacter sunyaminii]